MSFCTWQCCYIDCATDCAGTYIDVKIERHVGLTVSRCAILWTYDFTGRVMLRFRAVPTAGRRSRILTIKFSANVTSTNPVCRWLGYELPDIRVITVFSRIYPAGYTVFCMKSGRPAGYIKVQGVQVVFYRIH